MKRAVWLGIGVACLVGLAVGTHANAGLGPTVAGRNWSGWIKQDSGELITFSMHFQPNGETALQSYADLVVTKDGETSQYRGWVHESNWSRDATMNFTSFEIVGKRDVLISKENRKEEFKRDRKTLMEKSLGLLEISYKVRTHEKDPASAFIGTCKGFVEGRVGLISFDPAAMGR